MIDQKAITKLPFGKDFLFIQEIIESDCEREIVTEMRFDLDLALLQAHFKHGPHIVPGVLLVGHICQSTPLPGVLTAANTGGELSAGWTGRIRATFPSHARAPCVVRAIVQADRFFEKSVAYHGVAKVDGRDVCRVSAIGSKLPQDVIAP